MPISYNPKRVWDKLSPKLLNRLMDTVDRKPVEKRNRTVPAGWPHIEPSLQTRLDPVIRGVDFLACSEGARAIVELGRMTERDFPTIVREMNVHDIALWTWLEHPDIWRRALLLRQADAVSLGRHWRKRNGMPRRKPDVSHAALVDLAKALSAYFLESQSRGRFCHVEHLTRADGSDCFFVRLSDYAAIGDDFDAGGRLVARNGIPAFDVILTYSDSTGTLHTHAAGGGKVIGHIEGIFSMTVLGSLLPPENPGRPPYALDALISPSFRFTTEPEDGLSAVGVREIELRVRGAERRICLKCPGDSPRAMLDMIDDCLNKERLPRSLLTVGRARLRFKFAAGGPCRSFAFDVSKTSCTLKSKPEEIRVIGEKYLRLWGIDVA